jgi:hypothetical protein
MTAWLEEHAFPLVAKLLLNPITPEAMLDFEQALEAKLRELGREILEWTVNACEPEEAETAPHDVHSGAAGYRRLRDKTPAKVSTIFGQITLWRRGYRSWDRHDGEPVIFPLELQLGLLEGATPALADRIGRRMAAAGATQQTVLDWLRQDHGVVMGVARLRRLIDRLAENLDKHRQRWQIIQLIEWLRQANASRGRHKPSLAVGRDGITFHVQGVLEVGSTATISVYDRNGKRLGTVYLAEPSERFQATLSSQLTSLIKGTLTAWDGPQPRLCYVTDAGDAESAYYRKVLRPMRDPKRPHRRLQWIRIVDYYHVSQRITVMANALRFSCEGARIAWAKKMRKLLKQPGGAGRVLHSFFEGGRLLSIPAQHSKRLIVLRYLAETVFEEGRNYPEKEVNQLLALRHPDVASLRRYQIDEGFMDRAAGIYRLRDRADWPDII